DPETCMIVFKNHWAQVVKILEKHSPRFCPIPGDEANAVQNYVEHMLFLLMEEESGQSGAMGPILEFVVMENVMERLFVWSLRREFTDDMKVEQLKMYEMLVGQARQPLLHHKPILRPLMMLLSSCSGTAAPRVEAELVLLLNQLCCVLAKDPSILELFFHTSEDQGATNFLIFSLLIPFIHREGTVGQQARDALLLIMSLSAENERVAKHVAENTFFCPAQVLATGLSGLYSSLPTKLDVPSEDWHCLHREDWLQMPSLVQFLNSLEFCNAVIQVAHPDIRDQLVGYIYNGFLVPVLAPALHKLTLEEVMTTTAYLDLFLRSVTEPALLQTLLSFILLHQHEGVHILDTLISRINTPFQLGTVSLALFRTLIGLSCEDVMLQLILRYLIPCNHIMLSQRCVVRERDCYSVSASKILALTPSCCSPDRSPPPLRQLDSILFSKGAETPGGTGARECTVPVRVTAQRECTTRVTNKCLTEENRSIPEGADDSGHSCTIGSEIYLDVSYLHYLYDARRSISSCLRACRVWSAPYDGKDPPPDRRPPGARTPSTGVRKPVGVGVGRQLRRVPGADGRGRRGGRAAAARRASETHPGDEENGHPVGERLVREAQPGSAEAPLEKGPSPALPRSPTEHREDLLAQYEDLLRTLDTGAGGKAAPAEGESRKAVMDFSFIPETPEAEKVHSPFGAWGRSQALPFTGPFISVLLSRMENMLSNSLHVNLLLTGILAQLAAFPQPLLRAFLLNTNLVFQPSVRSLFQVLATVKQQIEELAAARRRLP
uniref:FHF complex subunit HOOK interacting protein 1A n=1 Tax=Tetraodon nigroviridis TaxID=99883 RepID=H3C251_TETNG